MQLALMVLTATLATGAAVVLGFGAQTELRRRPVARRPTPPSSRPTVVLSGETLFVRRTDAFTVGVDCLLRPPHTDGVRMPVHLQCYCPLLRWHQAMALVASLVGRWADDGAPLAAAVLGADGRTPRLRLTRDRSAVVLDVENGEVLVPLLVGLAGEDAAVPPLR